jgi:hypothetical protein
MRYTLAYGSANRLTFDLSDEVRVTDCAQPRGEPLADPAAAVIAALADPLEYPPLAAATVPGDKVVLAVEPGLPQVESVVAGVIYSLVENGTPPRDISVVIGSNLRSPLALVPKLVRHDVRVVLHNPADRDGLQYLAADKEARPIYLNRTLCDADLVLPLTISRLNESLGYVGGYSGLFPTFADLDTQQRFLAPSTTDHSVQQRQRRQEVDNAAWLLGVHFLMQVVPGQGDRLLHVQAGQAKAVMTHTQRQMDAAWLHPTGQKSSFAVVGIDGAEDQQTWENLARALYAGTQVVADGGAIALLTEVAARPGRALAHLAEAHPSAELRDELERDHTPDAHAAALLAEARERFDIYLLSGLASSLVEDIGIGYVDDAAQISRLAAKHRSVALLGSGQFAGWQQEVLVS